MSIVPIPINSGTGPKVAVDIIGTTNFQVVKIMQAADGSTASLTTGLVVTASGVTIASISTGTVSIVGTPAVTAANVTIASIATGSVSVINTPTITGNLTNVATITTLLGTVSVSGGGGGAQYSAGNTDMGSTGTGTISLGVQSGATIGRAIALTTSGQQLVQVSTGVVSVTNILSASGITVASIATGTVSIVGSPVYGIDSTNLSTTAGGIMMVGAQTGATTARAIALTVSGQQLVQVATGTVSIVGTPAVTASGVTIASITTGTVSIAAGTITTLLGTVSVSGGGGGVQYPINDTSMAATGTGTLILGLQSGATTSRALALTTTGGINVIQTVATITTLLGTVSVSGGGGGVQYGQDTTAQAATATGTVILGIQATTTRALVLTATGGINVVQTVATISTLLGTVSVSGGGGGVQYSQGDTTIGATGTGTIVFGVQSGATTARAIAITTTGGQHVNVQNVLSASGITIASITTGTVSVVNVLSASGVTIGNITGSSIYTVAGTALGTTGQGMLIMGIQSGSTAAQPIAVSATGYQYIATGTVNVVNTVAISGSASVINTVTITGSASISGTGNVTIAGGTAVGLVTTTASHAIIATAHASRFQAYALATTSAAAGVIIKTSGAHTLYITDVLISVPSPMNVGVYSETTGPIALVYLASQGGWAQSFQQPLICTTAQSLRVILSSSGTCSVTVQGYTVT